MQIRNIPEMDWFDLRERNISMIFNGLDENWVVDRPVPAQKSGWVATSQRPKHTRTMFKQLVWSFPSKAQ
jgi:hypothetical protein